MIVNLRSNGTDIEVCYSYYELRSSNSACVYKCYSGTVSSNTGHLWSSQFNYYYSDCDNVDACIATNKIMNINYAYGSVGENDVKNNNNTKNNNTKNNNTYNGAKSKTTNYCLLLLLFSFVFLLMI
jgi:hypothetical protein